MAVLGFNEEYTCKALGRFSHQQRMILGLSICERLEVLYGLNTDAAPIRSAIDTVWNHMITPEQVTRDMLEQQIHIIAQLDAADPGAENIMAGTRRDIRDAILSLLDGALEDITHTEGDLLDPEDHVMDIIRLSLDAVEILAHQNLRIQSWDRAAEEKFRGHPLVQDELTRLYDDMTKIWSITVNAETITSYRASLKSV